MKRLLLFVVVLLAGCNNDQYAKAEADRIRESNTQVSVRACLNKGGVPIFYIDFDGHSTMTRCDVVVLR